MNGPGSVIGEIFTSHPLIRKITFTGSTPVGKHIIKDSADTVKHLSMELGGHAPVIVCKDADIDFAVSQVITSKFRNAGQTCICANRVFVHEAVKDEFAEKLRAAAAELKVGNGMDKGVDIGPLINEKAFKKVKAQCQNAVNNGAEVLYGGQGTDDDGVYFFQPTILLNTTQKMDIMSEETFGPLLPVQGFTDIDAALDLANGLPFGLAAYYFTENYRTGLYIADRLDFGVLGWNDGAPSAAHAPFGGLKESGTGKEGGVEGIEAYLDTKYLSVGHLK